MLIRKIKLEKVIVRLLTAFSPATAGSAFLSSHYLLRLHKPDTAHFYLSSSDITELLAFYVHLMYNEKIRDEVFFNNFITYTWL